MTVGQQMNIGMNFSRVAKANPNHEAIVAADIKLPMASFGESSGDLPPACGSLALTGVPPSLFTRET